MSSGRVVLEFVADNGRLLVRESATGMVVLNVAGTRAAVAKVLPGELVKRGYAAAWLAEQSPASGVVVADNFVWLACNGGYSESFDRLPVSQEATT